MYHVLHQEKSCEIETQALYSIRYPIVHDRACIYHYRPKDVSETFGLLTTYANLRQFLRKLA